MKITRIPFDQVKQFSGRDIAYQTGAPSLHGFYKYPPELNAFDSVISHKKNQQVDRKLLTDTLLRQYEKITESKATLANIHLLNDEHTFTIITAHQPSLLTGPLYYIYKICSVINLCKQLKKTYSGYNFIPIFVSGGEDHDFDEVNHLQLYNQKITWNTRHDMESVGRMKLDGLSEVLDQVQAILRTDSDARKLLGNLKDYRNDADTYGEFVFRLVHKLFGHFGLVFLNMDDQGLKRSFIPIIKKEIFESTSKSLVLEEQRKLNEHGFKEQAFAREINFFLITDSGQRRRIERSGSSFHIVGTEITYSESEMETLIENEPERFSPNVIMRPIYQEFTLPNLAYIGGGGELAYWVERQSQFEAFGIPFPMLVRRNSVLLIDHGTQRNMEKTGFELMDSFENQDQVISKFLLTRSGDQFSLTGYIEQLEGIYEQISTKAGQIDPTLTGKVQAEKAKSRRTIEQLEGRLKKHIKQQSENDINKLKKIFAALRPGNSLQERKMNFLEFLDKYDISLIDQLVAELNPMDKSFLVIHL